MTGLASLRTNPGVRVFFKTNEGNILPEIRGGRQTKGFTLKKNIYWEETHANVIFFRRLSAQKKHVEPFQYYA